MRFLSFILLFLILTPLAAKDFDGRHADGIGYGTSLPDGWVPVESSPMEMIIKKSDDPHARLSILRYEIDEENRLISRYDILEAINGLYQQLGIGEIPFGEIELTLGEDRASFNIDYIENKHKLSANSDTVFIFLKGLIVRTEDNQQLFYLMSAYKSSFSDSLVSADLDNMINSFEITVPLAKSLFPKAFGTGYIFLFIFIVLMAFFYYRNKKVQDANNPFGGDSKYFWRCSSCQLANHVDRKNCQRCGTERLIDNILK